ncbi:MAG: PAS domain S-box protein, partial [Caldilineae bacterium]
PYPLSDFPAARRVLQTGEPVLLSAGDPSLHPAEADYMRHRRASDLLLLPLPVRGRRIGVVILDDAHRQKFTAIEIRLCQIVVEQVAIAIENVRLYEETDRLRAFNQNIVQSLEEGIVIEDEGGFLTFANPKAAEMLGYKPEEMTRLHWRDIVAPEEIPRVEREAAKRPRGQASRYETVCVTRTGARVPVIVSARPLFEEGRFCGVLAVFRDITARKQSEEILQQRNRRLELLYRAGQVFMSTLNLDEVLATVLEEVRRLLGVVACSVWLVDRKTGELVCRQVTNPQEEVVRGWRLPPGTGLAGWVAQHGRSLNVPDVRREPRHFKGVDETTGLPLRSILTVPLRAKGETIGVIQVVDDTVSRFNRDDQMLVESLAAAATRAIENARLYTALKQSQEYAHSIIDSSLDIIITVDKDRHIVEFNRAAEQAFGYRREEVVGRHVDILYANRQESRHVHETTLREGRCMREVTNRRKDGQLFSAYLSASVLRDADGALLG